MTRGLQLEDYIAEGKDKMLDFIGEVHDKDTRRRLELDFDFYVCGGPPPYAVDPTYWRCRLTGKVMHKAVAAVQRSKYGSRYQRSFYGEGGTFQKYKNLAARLVITFLYDPNIEFFPITTKTPCRWRSRSGDIVIASYHDLGYTIITLERQSQLGIKAQSREVSYGN